MLEQPDGLYVAAIDYDALAARLAEAREQAFRDAIDCMKDRQAKDHLAACLQDSFGVWWSKPADSADARKQALDVLLREGEALGLYNDERKP